MCNGAPLPNRNTCGIHKEPTSDEERDSRLLFFFVPSYIKVVPELEVSNFGVNATLGKGGVIIEGDDVHEALHNLIEDKD